MHGRQRTGRVHGDTQDGIDEGAVLLTGGLGDSIPTALPDHVAFWRPICPVFDAT